MLGNVWKNTCAWAGGLYTRSRLLRGLLGFAAVVVVLCVLFVLGSYAAPLLAQRYQHARSDVARLVRGDPNRAGVSGLIYVESPEVYTRQRLVNDRYLQDAWLRERLEEIDEPTAGWIEEAQADMRRAVLSVVASGGGESGKKSGEVTPEPGAQISDTALKELLKVPFDTKFQLQAEARDKIRQLILENALDDRHDLSGNTVFGLKFDTSILPGSEAYLNPTVVVRMDQNPLDRLFGLREAKSGTEMDRLRAPEDFLGYFMRYEQGTQANAPGTGDAPVWNISGPEIEILKQIDDYFGGWLLSLERRMAEYRGVAKPDCPDAKNGTVQRQLQTNMCIPAAEGKQQLGLWALNRIESAFGEVEKVDDALNFVTRATHFGPKTAEKLRTQVVNNARKSCGRLAAGETLSLQKFLTDEQANIPFKDASVPGIWGLFLDSQTLFRKADQPGLCPYDIDMSFGGSSVNLLVTEQSSTDSAGAALETKLLGEGGFEPLNCERTVCKEFNVWLERGTGGEATLTEEIKNSFTPAALEAIGRAAKSISQSVLCRLEQNGNQFLKTGADKEAIQADYDAIFGTGALRVTVQQCVAGRSLRLRLGAYEFFRRMAEVESYTYAAFPRGDVTGVVREVSEHQSLDLAGEASGVAGRAGFARSSGRSSIEAVPRVINFASGQSRSAQSEAEARKHFDFGWTVVKEGVKEPMMVSQLVLISMPAYMDEISLTLWKGFLDLDKVPPDRSAPLTEDQSSVWQRIAAWRPFGARTEAAGNAPKGDIREPNSYADMSFEEYIEFLMKGYDRGTITLKVPPDFNALDSIVIGRSEIVGPQINTDAMDQAVGSDDPDQNDGGEEDAEQREEEGATECVRWSKVELSKTDAGKDEQPYYHVELIIPGERLWRSTVVTLGGAKAQRIEVMPDMRGILATFRLEEKPVPGISRIWVWTSEGRATARVRVCDEKGQYLAEGAAP